MIRAVCAAVMMLSWHAAVWAQSAPNHTSAHKSSARSDAPAFEPLARWKAAVLAGNQQALAALYSAVPPARAKTPQGDTQDPREEPLFWSALASQGLAKFEPKVLEIQHPQPGAAALVLRVELKLRTSSGEQPFVVSVSQLWVEQGGGWRIFATQRGNLVPNPPRRLPEPAKPNTDLYPAPEEARTEIAAALSAAAKDHRRVILVFGANWCYDCHVLDAAFHAKDMAPLVHANFHVVHVNIGEDYDKNLDLAAKYEVPLNKGVPALAVLDSGGKVIFSQKQGEFENSVRIGPADVTAFLKKWALPRRN
jgi:thiol-disulfide isomerase/thioredoxin